MRPESNCNHLCLFAREYAYNYGLELPVKPLMNHKKPKIWIMGISQDQTMEVGKKNTRWTTITTTNSNKRLKVTVPEEKRLQSFPSPFVTMLSKPVSCELCTCALNPQLLVVYVYRKHLVWMHACCKKSLAAESCRGEFGVEKGFTMCLAFPQDALVPILFYIRHQRPI